MKVMINGIDIDYEGRGSGTAVLFLHGYPLDRSIWAPVVARLRGPYRLITPDLRGFGRSAAPEGAYPMALLAEDARALLDHLGIARAVLVGHSMGGYACLAFARAYPERLAGLALVASRAAADTPEQAAGRHNGAREILAGGVASVAASMPARLTADPRLTDDLRELIARQRPQGLAGALLGMAERPDSTPFLAEIRVPALVVAGAADAIVPVDEARGVAAAIPGCRLEIVPGAGHMPMLEAPDATAAALQCLLDEVGGAER